VKSEEQNCPSINSGLIQSPGKVRKQQATHAAMKSFTISDVLPSLDTADGPSDRDINARVN